jgi:ribonuclease Z
MEATGCMKQIMAAVFLLCASSCPAAPQARDAMKITLLGTGTPFPNADRYGAAILVEAGGQKLLFDCGRGALIRLTEAGVNPSEVDKLFLTHLHSDHVVGIPDLWLTGWFLGRGEPLKIWGPKGTQSLAEHLPQAFAADIAAREAPPENLPSEGVRIDAEEIEQGVVYEDGGVRVTAFLVDHGNVKPTFGYRVDYAGHAVVISGDTKFSENLIRFGKGADCLLHIAWLPDARNPTPPSERTVASAEDAGRIFEAVKPKLAVVYHYKNAEGIAEAVKTEYRGSLVIGQDLMAIDVGKEVTWRASSVHNSKGKSGEK